MESSRALMDLAVAQEISARQRHHHRQHRGAGLGAGARQRTQQGRRRRARGAGDAADQAPAGKGLIMADEQEAGKSAGQEGRRQEGQPARRGAARRRAGALPDGHRRRRAQRHLRRVRKPLARQRGRGRQISAGGGRVLPRRRLRRGARPGEARSADRRCAVKGLAAEADRRDSARGAARRAPTSWSTARTCPAASWCRNMSTSRTPSSKSDETGMVNAVLDQIARQFRADEFSRG